MDRGRQQRSRIVAMLALLVWSVGCFGRAPLPPPPEGDPMDRESYVIGVTDVLKIDVWRQPELSDEACRRFLVGVGGQRGQHGAELRR